MSVKVEIGGTNSPGMEVLIYVQESGTIESYHSFLVSEDLLQEIPYC